MCRSVKIDHAIADPPMRIARRRINNFRSARSCEIRRHGAQISTGWEAVRTPPTNSPSPGSIAPSTHYSATSRTLWEIVSRAFGIHLVCYFGDFGGHPPPPTPPRSQVRSPSNISGFPRDPGHWGQSGEFQMGGPCSILGVAGCYH